MDRFNDLATMAFNVLSLALLLGGGALFVRGSYNKAKLVELQEELNRETQKTDRLERDLEKVNVELVSLKEQKQTLLEAISQRADVESLKQDMAALASEVSSLTTELRRR